MPVPSESTFPATSGIYPESFAAFSGRVLIALDDGPLVWEPVWTRFDELANCRCEGFDWTRGRQSELDVTETGTARVYFHDRANTFDGEELIGLQIMLQLHNPVADEWQPVFRGHIDDLPAQPNAGAPELTNVQVDCVGLFDYLAGVKMVPGVFGDPGGPSSVVFYENGPVDERITSLLDDAQVDPGQYVVFSGNVLLNEAQLDESDDVLSAIRDAADSEFPGIANVYEDRLGRVVFHGRFARFTPDDVADDAGPDAWTFNRWEAATRADVGTTRAQIREFEFNRPRSRIINSYVAWPEQDERGYTFRQEKIPDLTKTDAGSIAAYGYRGREAPALNIQKHKTNGNTGADECELIGEFWVGNYSVPRKNLQRVTLKTLRPSNSRAPATWDMMCRMDISDIVELWVDEAGLEGDEFYVEGIAGTCRRSGNAAFDIVTVSPNLSPAAYYLDNVFAS